MTRSAMGSGGKRCAADWAFAALVPLAWAGFTVGSLPLLALVAGREGLGPFGPAPAVAVVAVSTLLMVAAVRGLGRAGGERVARRLGEHRRPEEVYGPDATPVRPALVALGVLPLLLVAPLGAVLVTGGLAGGVLGVVLPLVAAALVPVCAAQLGRSTLVVVAAPWCLATAIVALRVPWPVPAALLLVQALVGWAVLGRWLWRRTRAPRAVGSSAPWCVLALPCADGVDLALAIDPARWVLPPVDAPSAASPPSWARTTSRRRWNDAERPPYDGEIAGLARRLEVCVRGLAPSETGHAVLHLPTPWEEPLPVHLESWARVDGADQDVLSALVEVDLVSPPRHATVGTFRTSVLGDGIKALVRPAPGEGETVLTYAWRLGSLGVDVRVQASAVDARRVVDAVGDVEALLDGLTVDEEGSLDRRDAITRAFFAHDRLLGHAVPAANERGQPDPTPGRG